MTAGPPGHTHRLPRGLLLLLIIICAGLVVSICLASVQTARAQREAAETHARLDALESFIHARTIERDQQYTTLQDAIDAAFCEVFDQLPAGGLLDQSRTEHGCGPGIPVERLTPEARANLQQYATSAPLTTSDGYRDREDNFAQPDPRYSTSAPQSVAPPRAPVTPAVPSQAPTAVPSQPAAPTTPVPVLPYIDPTQVTSSLCERLNTCLPALPPLDRKLPR